jgi:Skp family chaperone for outer membrane proteins
MKILLKSAMVASLMAAAAPIPVFAQNAAPAVAGIAVANIEGAVASSQANQTAAQQRQTTYKAQIDAAEARGRQLNAQLQPLAEKYQRDSQAASPNRAALEQQVAQIQQLRESGQQELQRMLQPVALSEAYVEEQIQEKLDQAVKAAMAKKRISLLLNPQAVVLVTNQAYNLTPDIVTELNTLVPSVQIVPPAGWEPRQVREARAAQQQQGAAPAAQTPAPAATPAPSGR